MAMESGVGFLVGQVEEEGKEAWKKDHDEAMECQDLEDMLGLGIALYHMIRRGDEAWSKKVQAGTVAFDADRAKTIHGAYEWWMIPCDTLLATVQKMEVAFQVEHAEEFRRCVRRVRHLLDIGVNELIESFAQASRGELEPLTAEVWGGLPDSKNA
jgi:hypothetical protein